MPNTSFSGPRWRLLRLKAACLIVLCATALSVSPIYAGDTAGAYKLAPGDRLTVTVLGQTELSGDFPLDEAGRIQFPIVGSVDVRGLRVDECQQLLSARLADGILTEPSVFVRMAEMRPIQILGDVRNSGSYPFRYGTLVKGAVAFAGGFGSSQPSAAAALSDYLAANERVLVLDMSRSRLAVRQARLRAELDRAASFDPPETATGDAEMKRYLDDERNAFQTRSADVKRQVELIVAQRPRLVAESEAIDRQIESERKQIELVKKQIEAYEKLQRNGLTKLDSIIQIQLSAATKESNLWRLEADRSRLKREIGELEIRVQDAETAYRRQVAGELQETMQRLNEVAVTLPAARDIRDAKFRDAANPTGTGPSRSYSITRVRDQEIVTIEATDITPLEPGDIVEVKTLPGSEKNVPFAALVPKITETEHMLTEAAPLPFMKAAAENRLP